MVSSPTQEESTEEGILEDSGLTEEQRREIRRRQRELYKDLEEQDNLKVEVARDRNNEIYKDVKYTREAVLDGDNMTLIATKAAKEVDRLIQVPRYDADRLVSKLFQKCRSSTGGSGAYFDWAALGLEAGVCFNSIPSNVSFLNGPLQDGQPVQVRQRMHRRQERVAEDNAREEKPEDVQGHTHKDADQLSAIEQSMMAMSKILKKKVDRKYRENKKRLSERYHGKIPEPVKKKLKKHGVEINAVQFLFNPNSFTQTVENIFHYSFLVKKGFASICVRERAFGDEGVVAEPGPLIKYINETQKPPPRQEILSLTMKDWRDLCKAYNVSEGDLPHRSGSKHARDRKSVV